jgi:preprotein translocase subunit SecF
MRRKTIGLEEITVDIIGKRYLYFAISVLLILPGFIALLVWGLPLGVDFSGGSLVELQFTEEVPSFEDVRGLYDEFGISSVEPRPTEQNGLSIRSKHISDGLSQEIILAMETRFDQEIVVLRFDSVGPSVGREVAVRAAQTVAIASIAIMLYIWYAFRGVTNAHRYGVSAIIAMLHDVAVIFGVQAVLSRYLGWEVDALFLTAVLTVIGFSVHDSIVVFDRIRENAMNFRRIPYEKIVNDSIVQSLVRSINTQLTVFLALLALVIFGGSTIRHFIVVLMIGVLSGTYSSLFNAAPILVVWENEEWKTWFGKKRGKRKKRK